MSKWADYVITCVNYNKDGNRIATVGVHAKNPQNKRTIWTRDEVVKELDNGKTFMTATKDRQGKWEKGAEVLPHEVKGERFIQTNPNDTAEDNLGKLPTCS